MWCAQNDRWKTFRVAANALMMNLYICIYVIVHMYMCIWTRLIKKYFPAYYLDFNLWMTSLFLFLFVYRSMWHCQLMYTCIHFLHLRKSLAHEQLTGTSWSEPTLVCSRSQMIQLQMYVMSVTVFWTSILEVLIIVPYLPLLLNDCVFQSRTST